MKKLVLVLSLLIFVFIGCQGNQLQSPKNIAYDLEGFIIWDEVENAEEYLVKIGGLEYMTEIAVYDITDIISEKGSYVVEIIALAEGFNDSDVSSYTMKVGYNEDASINLFIQGDNLVWEDVFLASHYIVTYGTNFVRVNESSFSLAELNEGNHELFVVAIFDAKSSTEQFSIEYTK